MTTITRRTTGLLRGAAVIAGTIAFMVGIPWALLHFVGNPFPTVIPSFDDIRFALTNGQVDQWTFIKGVALVTWAAWAHLAASFTVEIAAAIRGGTAAAVRGLGATQWVAAKIVSQFSLVFTLIFQSTVGVAVAAPLPAIPAATAAPAEVVHVEPASMTEDGDSAEQLGGDEVTIGRRDTLWGLAQTHLGDGERWEEIRDANVGRVMADGTVLAAGFTSLETGWTLVVPGLQRADTEGSNDAAEDLETGRDTATGEWIIGSWSVEPGDHFWMISETMLAEAWGRPASDAEIHRYWYHMVEANREHLISDGSNPNLIYPDQQFEVLLPPLPADLTTADDTRATTTPFPVDGLDQFTPLAPGRAERTPITPRPPEPAEVTTPTPAPEPDRTPAPTAPPVAAEPAEVTAPVSLEPASAAAPAPETGIDVRTVALGLFGTAVGAGSLMFLLRRRRRVQAARRRPETVIEETPILPSELEERIRPIGDTETVRWLNATNHFLTHRLSLHPEANLPAVIAMRAGAHGVELLLDDACKPVEGFINGGAAGKAWRLHPDLQPRELEAEAGQAQPYSPALLPVGETEAGDLLLDFEQIGSIALSGDNDTIVGWLRSIAVGVTSVAWSQQCEVIAIGVDDALADIAQVIVPENPEAWAEQAVRRHQATAQRLQASPYEQRVNPGEIHWPEVVLVGPGFEGIAQHLTQAADLAFSPLALVAAAPLRSETRIEMQPDLATVEPLALNFDPAVTTTEAITLAVSALAATEHTVTIPDDIFNNPTPIESVTSDDWQPGSEREAAPPAAELAEVLEEIDLRGGEPIEVPTVLEDVAQPVNEAPQQDEDDEDPDPPDGPGRGAPIEKGSTPDSETDTFTVPLTEVAGSPNGHSNGSTGETTEAIRAIEEQCPVEAKILAATPSIEGLTKAPQPKSGAIISYLAFSRSVSAERIRSVFWPRSVSRSTCDNAITEVRRLLGTGDDGESRLPLDRATGRFELSAEVGSDWDRVERLVELSDTVDADEERIACLQTALSHVDGRPCEEAAMKHFRWFLDDHEVYTRVETVLVDAAYRLGELAYEAGEPELARWAADKGLLVVPGQEALHRIQMKAASLAGDEQGVEDAYRAAMRSAEALSAWEDVQPETDELYAKLTRRQIATPLPTSLDRQQP